MVLPTDGIPIVVRRKHVRKFRVEDQMENGKKGKQGFSANREERKKKARGKRGVKGCWKMEGESKEKGHKHVHGKSLGQSHKESLKSHNPAKGRVLQQIILCKVEKKEQGCCFIKNHFGEKDPSSSISIS